MRILDAPVHVRVPATSANLGPGFDCAGLALDLYDDVVVQVTGSELVVEVTGEGAGDVSRGEDHLIVSSLRTVLERLGVTAPGLLVRCTNRIPHARGLGSSSAAIVAAVLAARALVPDGRLVDGGRMDDEAALRVADELEGHPDNVAACLRGGATFAWTEAVGARAIRLEPHGDLAPVAFVPSNRASTQQVRGLLPVQVPYADAVLNASRAALLVHALTTDPALLLPATEDRLHQSYRAPAMPASAGLVAELRAGGVPAVISGAGPTVLALVTRAQRPTLLVDRRGWQPLALDVARAGASARPAGGRA